ncbi:MAG: phosphoenolpyruvate--protein phosphotransferase [Candidatus Hydrogenedentes bacterium CG07_land_8_20_14_0_80_42_17]|nr:MAG: phosphoenolpyruvate--protein phosphotransferase [Candidatus Hydrogenedentes bacterium CG07_land_8_20_14_0_80_42_17]
MLMNIFYGTPISPGFAEAPPLLVQGMKLKSEERAISSNEVEKEFKRFTDAIEATKNELLAIRDKTAEEIGEDEAEIFDAHILVLEDPLLHVEVSRKLESEQKNVEIVLQMVIDDLAERFSKIEDEMMRERATDIADVGQILIRNLMGRPSAAIRIDEPCILVATEISPSTAAKLDSELVLGCVTEIGSVTSHTAIIARALGIPAVVVPPGTITELQNANTIIVDGMDGAVVADPDEKTIEEYEEKEQKRLEREIMLRRKIGLDAVTTDGVKIDISANIEMPIEIKIAKENGAEGVGLYRTEFLFLNRKVLPSEEEQYQHYRLAAEAFPQNDVIIRTIDVGGDKFLSGSGMPEDVNPYLGVRAIRFSLVKPDIFNSQIRAIIRASRHGKVKLLLPMISCIEEISSAMGYIDECCKKFDLDSDCIEVGIMIETPAAALNTKIFSNYMDFFSIGTNDLIQYTMAAERGNKQLDYLHRPMQPTIIRLIKEVTDNAKATGIELSVCGEMAGDLRMIPILVGLGITKLSMNPRSIPVAKEMIRRISFEESSSVAKEIAQLLFTKDAVDKVEKTFGERVKSLEINGARFQD